MNRDDKDVFEPTSFGFTPRAEGPSSLCLPPGPSAQWTAEGVIKALEPLSGEERRLRLRNTLAHRLASVTVVLDNPHDPHNGSAVLRSCDAFGVQRVHVVRGEESFKASRLVSKGSERWVDVIEHQAPQSAIEHLKNHDFVVLATHPEGQLLPSDLSGIDRVALVLGNERDGVGPELTGAADDTIRIPMCGFVESLNMSVTAAILLQAACQGRKGDLSPLFEQNTYARWLRNSVPRSDEVLSALVPC